VQEIRIIGSVDNSGKLIVDRFVRIVVGGTLFSQNY
jgi:hypothetical protein